MPRPRASARPRAATPPSDSPLTRERILSAGLALLSRQGVAGLSMRELADAVGTAPMSLYRHVRSKDELLSGIVALALERLDLDLPACGPWTERAAALMQTLRDQLRRSPPVVSMLMRHGQYAPALLRAMNTLLRMLREAGFAGGDAVGAAREIMWSTLGFVAAEIQGPAFSPAFYLQAMSTGPEPSGEQLRPEDVNEVAAHMPHLLTRNLDAVFASMLRHLLAGQAAELSERGHAGRGAAAARRLTNAAPARPQGTRQDLDRPRRSRLSTHHKHGGRAVPSA